MDKNELKKMLYDDTIMKDIVKDYIDFDGNFKAIEAKRGIGIGDLEDIFYEDEELEIKFQDALGSLINGKLQRESSIKMANLVKTLFDVVENDTAPSDGGPTVKDKVSAANTLAKILEKTNKPKGKEKGDKLDDLWK